MHPSEHQVKYISEVKSLDRVFYHFYKVLITDTMARQLILEYADADYDTESDDDDDLRNIMHNLIGVYEN